MGCSLTRFLAESLETDFWGWLSKLKARRAQLPVCIQGAMGLNNMFAIAIALAKEIPGGGNEIEVWLTLWSSKHL